jgi:hypothetical protein
MASEPGAPAPRTRRLQSGEHTLTLLRLMDVHEEERLVKRDRRAVPGRRYASACFSAISPITGNLNIWPW